MFVFGVLTLYFCSKSAITSRPLRRSIPHVKPVRSTDNAVVNLPHAAEVGTQASKQQKKRPSPDRIAVVY